MSILRNLLPGQYQIGDLVFGRGTTVPVEIFDVKPDDINTQDHQLARNDEIVFGQDQFKPTTIEITFDVRYNWLLPKYEGTIPNFWSEMPDVSDFAREWRADGIRKNWNAIEPLYVCGRDGITRAVYGRPGQFTRAESRDFTEAVQCLGQWRRSDTLSYTAKETAIEMFHNADPTFIRRDMKINGDMDCWFRVFAVGPMTNPRITVGDKSIDLDTTLAAGEVLEVSSYPWQRRAVNDKRMNLSASMVGKSNYLDRLQIPIGANVPLRWTSDEVNTFVPALGNKSWALDINGLNFFKIPDTFTTIAGRVLIGLDIFNPAPFRLYLTASPLEDPAAILYNHKQFNTANQYSEATIVEPFFGRSAIVIMSNTTMTNYVLLEVTSAFGNNRLKIRTGSDYHTYSGVLAEWINPAFFGWLETDKVAIGSSLNISTGITTYKAYFNGVEKCSWTDSGHVVNTSATNRSQGYIFDMDGSLFTFGTGFRSLLSYDTAVVPAPTGRVFISWHDAWSTLP